MFDLDKEKLLILITLCFDVLFIMGIVAWYLTKDAKFFILSGLCISGSLSLYSLTISIQR